MYSPYYSKVLGRERGYAYFQDYVPNNNCDYRLKIIGDKCWGLRRMVRKGDFRASGSNIYDWDIKGIPIEMVKLAFDIADKLKLQCVAFDFVLDENQQALVI